MKKWRDMPRDSARFALYFPETKRTNGGMKMLKRLLAITAVVITLCVAAAAQAATFFVDAGNDPLLTSTLAVSPPCSVIVINQPVGGPYAPFILPVTLNPNNSGTKIMAAPGEVAVFDVAGTAFTVTPGTTNVILENLVITGPSGGSGVEVQGNAIAKIINCQITCKGAGVLVSGSGLAEIQGSRILNNGIGVVLQSLPTSAFATVEDTQVRNNDFGILLRGRAGKAKVWHSQIDRNISDGIRVEPTNWAVLNNNDISFNGQTGVFYDLGAFGSLSFNTIAFNGGYGVNNLSGVVNVNGSPGNNTISGNLPPNVNPGGLPVAQNQINP